MGYTTDFQGSFQVNEPVDNATFELLLGLATTRRMKRSLKGFGVDGEFYIGDKENFGQNHTADIIDYNSPPKTQPSLWCQWLIQADRQTIEHDGGEKFYAYADWLKYLVNKVLSPKGYVLNGQVEWQGEEPSDRGLIIAKDNQIITKTARIVYE